MLGRRSLSLPLISCDLDIEHILRQLTTKRNFICYESVTLKPWLGGEQPVALRDQYLSNTYTFPSCLQLLDITIAHYEIKPNTIQSLQFFIGLSNDNPYKLLDEFLEICSTIKHICISISCSLFLSDDDTYLCDDFRFLRLLYIPIHLL